MVFGGLTAMVFRSSHTAINMGLLLRKLDLRSMFFATVFTIILLVLACLTNPSETSFRTYLTEQSFRQHLSRLDDNAQDEHAEREDSGVHYSLARRTHPASHKPGPHSDTNSPFHFVKRASVSLRTPKHVFRSFGILTIAAVSPPARSQPHILRNEGLGPMVSDSWFIGIFGKWWRGGTIPPRCNDALDHIKDAERCSSGILDLKALDSLQGYDGLPFSTPSLRALPNSQDVSQKSRGSERSAQRATNNAPRSTTPPPLPKSASLPLHAPRVPVATPPKNERGASQRMGPAPSQTQAPSKAEHSAPHPAAFPPPSTSYFDQSPMIADIVRQISHSNAAVHDLRTQLTDFRAASSESRAAIQGDLEAHRERKRAEDASRVELKARTKTLEDSKRATESSKRDAEKRLRAAEGLRDNASQRIERLDKEIGALQGRMREDEQAAVRCTEESDAAEREMTQQVELKKKEINVAEDVIAALNVRAKELEERIVEEEKRLQRAREQAEMRKQDCSFFPLHVVGTASVDPSSGPWSPIAPYDQSYTQDPHTHINTDFSEHIDVFPPSLQVPPPSRRSSGSGRHKDFSVSPRPRHLSLGGISNFREHVHPVVSEDSGSQVFLRPPTFPIPLSSAQSHSTRFSPFSDNDVDVGGVLSPRSTSLISTSLISSLEGGGGAEEAVSRSFETEGDAVVPPDWRKRYPPPLPIQVPSVFTTSPTSITCPSFDGVDKEDPFEIRPPPPLRHRLTTDAMDMQRALFPPPSRTTSDPPPLTRARSREADDKAGGAHRRWFSADPKEKEREREKKGLNPEAKVFRLAKKSLPSSLVTPPPLAFNPLAPSQQQQHASAASTLSLPSMLAPPPAEPSALLSSISMRAFAPSPAEREALQRALGGSSSGSLERLPTLSEVAIASMPPSPSHVQAIAAQHHPGGRTLLPPGLSWLQLPRMRKHKFSPWEDADEVPTEAGAGGTSNASH
ncbi:hypothetical protein BKA93DRAFT_731803 [Sparassis latifolia]